MTTLVRTVPPGTPFDLGAGDRTLYPHGQRAGRVLDQHTDGRALVRPRDLTTLNTDDWSTTVDERTGESVDIRRADCGGGCRCAAQVRTTPRTRRAAR